MRSKKVKYPNGVGIYDLDNNLVKSFDYAPDIAIYLNVSKVTVSKYINRGLVFKGKYYLKINPFNEKKVFIDLLHLRNQSWLVVLWQSIPLLYLYFSF